MAFQESPITTVNQGLQNYRHLKMMIPIPIPAVYDDTDTGCI